MGFVKTVGQVASLHLHPKVSGEPLMTVSQIEVEAGKGIIGEPRYFGRKTRTGDPSKRQLSVISREQVAEHVATLGLGEISPGVVRSNIETTGVDLISLVGREVQIGEAVVLFYEPRTPCQQMDRICNGLRELMANGKQGVMAQILKSGRISVGDEIRAVQGPI
jgi:MOSC domain-containing protein YiiM